MPAPDWIEAAAQFNPVNWAVEAGCEAQVADADIGFDVIRLAGLSIVAVLAVLVIVKPEGTLTVTYERQPLNEPVEQPATKIMSAVRRNGAGCGKAM